MCALFPGSITPFNVWDLPWVYWQGFAAYVDEHVASMREAARNG